MRLSLFLVALGITTGCATGIALTDRGARVEHIERAAVGDGCRMAGDVSIGIPPDAARPRSEEQLITLMRNKAGEMGATHVVTETSDRRTGSAGEIYYVGRGLAYTCPRDVRVVSAGETGGEGESSGGEAPPDDEAPPSD